MVFCYIIVVYRRCHTQPRKNCSANAAERACNLHTSHNSGGHFACKPMCSASGVSVMWSTVSVFGLHYSVGSYIKLSGIHGGWC